MSSEPAPVFRGSYSDGRTAAAHPVEVRFGPEGLQITAPDGTAADTWAYGTLAAAQPVRARDADTTLSPGRHTGANLHVAAPGFAARLLARAPHLGPRAQTWRSLKPMLAVTAVAALAAGAVVAFDLSPARTAALMVPEQVWQQAGNQALQSFTGHSRSCMDTKGRAALDRLMARLTAATGRDVAFDVHVADWNLLNAFALPGRKIVLTRKIVESADSADQLAGVIAHEMGHGIERDPEAGLVRALGLSLFTEILFSGSSGTLGNFGAHLLMLRYTRAAERQADRHALAILRGARISSRPFSVFFERLEKKAGEDGRDAGSPSLGGLEAILSTHPPSAERARLAAEQPSYTAWPALRPADWRALKGICGHRPPV